MPLELALVYVCVYVRELEVQWGVSESYFVAECPLLIHVHVLIVGAFMWCNRNLVIRN